MVSISILISFASAEELLGNTDNDGNLHSQSNLFILFIKIYLINIMQIIQCNT